MRLFRLLSLLLVAAIVTGCNKEPNNNLRQPVMAVTYTTLDGCWMLSQWNGEALQEDTYLYITFERTEHSFEMWDNIGSMYATQTTGKFSIATDDRERYILSGWYDYGAGDWSDDYFVTMPYPGDEMVWRSTTSEEQMTFSRVDRLPDFN